MGTSDKIEVGCATDAQECVRLHLSGANGAESFAAIVRANYTREFVQEASDALLRELGSGVTGNDAHLSGWSGRISRAVPRVQVGDKFILACTPLRVAFKLRADFSSPSRGKSAKVLTARVSEREEKSANPARDDQARALLASLRAGGDAGDTWASANARAVCGVLARIAGELTDKRMREVVALTLATYEQHSAHEDAGE